MNMEIVFKLILHYFFYRMWSNKCETNLTYDLIDDSKFEIYTFSFSTSSKLKEIKEISGKLNARIISMKSLSVLFAFNS